LKGPKVDDGSRWKIAQKQTCQRAAEIAAIEQDGRAQAHDERAIEDALKTAISLIG
jgi:hypothetical protein